MHESFLDAIRDRPGDDAPLLIYADWLEERGDPRAEYIRLGAELAGLAPGDGRALGLRARFREVRAAVDHAWVAAMEQPGILRANPTPYPAGWWGVGMTDGQHCGYQLWEYDRLAVLPLGEIHRSLDWLDADSPLRPPIVRKGMGFWPARMLADEVRDAIRVYGIGECLPANYLNVITRFELSWRLTGAKFVVDAPFIPVAGDPPIYLLRLISNPRRSLHWYLHLCPLGGHCVVVSPHNLGHHRPDRAEEGWGGDEGIPLWYCAPSLETFLYRWLLEAQIWYAIQNGHRGGRLTAAGRAYLEQYGPVPPDW